MKDRDYTNILNSFILCNKGVKSTLLFQVAIVLDLCKFPKPDCFYQYTSPCWIINSQEEFQIICTFLELTCLIKRNSGIFFFFFLY